MSESQSLTPSLKKKAVSGVIGYAIRTIFLYVIAIGATALLSSYLTPADFGIYYIVTAVISLFTFISDIGLAATLVQKKAEPTLSELRTAFTVQQLLAFLIVIVTIALTPVWQQYAGITKEGMRLLYALSFSFILASLKTIPSILLERRLEFNRLVVPQMVEQIIFYGLAVFLAQKGWGVESFTLAVVARSIAGVMVIYLLQRWSLGFSLSRSALAGLIPFGFKFQLNDFLARIKDDLFVVVLSRFISPMEMGYIGWAKRWSMFPYQMSVNSVVAVTFPTFSRLQTDRAKLGRAIEKTIFFISLLIFPVLTGMSLLAYALIRLVPSYSKWEPALLSLGLFSVNVGLAALSTPLTNTLNAIGNISTSLRLMLMWTGLTWTITPLLLWLLGYQGVAAAAALIGFTSFITVKLAQRAVPFDFLNQVWRQAVAAIVMGGFLFMTQAFAAQSWFHLLLIVCSGGILYTTTFLLMGYTKIKDEIRSLRR